jgi:hypothetical protein
MKLVHIPLRNHGTLIAPSVNVAAANAAAEFQGKSIRAGSMNCTAKTAPRPATPRWKASQKLACDRPGRTSGAPSRTIGNRHRQQIARIENPNV